MPALSVTSTFTLSPGLIGSVVISKFPLSSVVPVPIILPSLSVTTTGAFGSSEWPFTIPLSGLPSAGLFVSTGVTVSTSTFGAVVSTSMLPDTSLLALPAWSTILAVTLDVWPSVTGTFISTWPAVLSAFVIVWDSSAPPFTVYLITSPTTASVGIEILAVVLALSPSLLFSALFSLPSFGLVSSTNVIVGSDGAVWSFGCSISLATTLSVPALPALSIAWTNTGVPGWTALSSWIKKSPVLLAWPFPIMLLFSSLNNISAFGVSVWPVAIVSSAVSSALLFVSIGVILTLSSFGAIESRSIVASLLGVLLPNLFSAVAVNLCSPCLVRAVVVTSHEPSDLAVVSPTLLPLS